jgi:hypothetical protein
MDEKGQSVVLNKDEVIRVSDTPQSRTATLIQYADSSSTDRLTCSVIASNAIADDKANDGKRSVTGPAMLNGLYSLYFILYHHHH